MLASGFVHNTEGGRYFLDGCIFLHDSRPSESGIPSNDFEALAELVDIGKRVGDGPSVNRR